MHVFTSPFAGVARCLRRAPLVVVFGALAGSAHAFSNYHVVDIGIPPGTFATYGFAINDSGQVTGHVYEDFKDEAFLYTNGSTTIIHDLNSETNVGFGINNNGEAVGWYNATSGNFETFVYSNGVVEYPPIPVNSIGEGINSSDQITGFYQSYNGQIHAFLYTKTSLGWGNGDFTDLGSLGGPDRISYGLAINESGAITGLSDTAAGATHAFIYQNGVMTDLGSLDNTSSSVGVAINDAGTVAGYTSNGAKTVAFIYKNGVMTKLPGFSDTESSQSNGVNNAGDIVGSYTSSPSPTTHPFIYSNGQTADLNTLIDSSLRWTLTDARDINNHGQIISDAIDNLTGEGHTLILNPIPVPEPSGWIGFGFGALSVLTLMARGRNKRSLASSK